MENSRTLPAGAYLAPVLLRSINGCSVGVCPVCSKAFCQSCNAPVSRGVRSLAASNDDGDVATSPARRQAAFNLKYGALLDCGQAARSLASS